MLPREKLIKYGANNLLEYELLAIILGVGSSGENVFELSKKILDNYPNLKQLLSITYEELIDIKGEKQAKATKILASIEFAKRIFEYNPNYLTLDNPNTIHSLMRYELEGKSHEEFFVLYLDNNLRLIKKEMISKGGGFIVTFEVKDIFKTAIKLNCSNIVMVHNHPSGNLEPSESDIKATIKVMEAGNKLDITLIDHIIISGNRYYSIMENHKPKK